MGQGETLVLHLGQCGCQAGMSMWELFCLEHGLYPDGTLATDMGHVKNDGETAPFFMETCPCRYTPRAVFFDFDPDVITPIKTGCYRSLFSRDNLAAGKEDAAANFARGYYSMGHEFVECIEDKMRHLAEAAGNVTGFVIMRATGGGTGAGFGSLMMEKLAEMFGKTTKITIECSPSADYQTAAVEPYNSILTAHASSDFADCCFTYENQCVYDICSRYLELRCPNYHHVNQIMAQVISGFTAPFRFPGGQNTDITDLQTNLVPFARVHFPLLTYAPWIPYEKVRYDRLTIESLVRQVFTPNSQLVKCNTRQGKYMACALLFRGDVSPNELNRVLEMLKHNTSQKHRMQFVDWCPGGFKLSRCDPPPICVPGSALSCTCRAVVGIHNNTAIGETWQRLLNKFNSMFDRRAFVHWYLGEGMEENEFQEARENIQTLIKDFEEIGKDTEIEPGSKYLPRRKTLSHR